MSWSDTLDLEILGGVACEFQDFSGQIFQDSGDVYGSCTSKGSVFCFLVIVLDGRTFGTNTHLVLSVVLEESLDSTAGKLERNRH